MAYPWNVQSLIWEGTASKLFNVFETINANITAVQEGRWTGQGRQRVGLC